jgi:polyisoprenoid-binding protein YceI
MRFASSLSCWSIGLTAVALLPATSVAAPVRYRLDPDHTFVHFEVMHFGTSTLRGRFGPLTGAALLDAEAASGEVSLVIPLDTLDTGLRVLDRRLCQPDLLDCAAQPQAWFVARRFQFQGPSLKALDGELTLRGVSRGVHLQAERFSCRVDAQHGRQVCGGDFVGRLRRSDFGADFGLPFVADAVTLRVQVEGVREEPDTPR